jgi:hypothetical protein
MSKKLILTFATTAFLFCALSTDNCYCLKMVAPKIAFEGTFKPILRINANLVIGEFKDSSILSGPSKLKAIGISGANASEKRKWDYLVAEINGVTKMFMDLDKKFSKIFTKLTDIIKNKTLSQEERLDLISAWNSDFQSQNIKSNGTLVKQISELSRKYFSIKKNLYQIFVRTQYPKSMN